MQRKGAAHLVVVGQLPTTALVGGPDGGGPGTLHEPDTDGEDEQGHEAEGHAQLVGHVIPVGLEGQLILVPTADVRHVDLHETAGIRTGVVDGPAEGDDKDEGTECLECLQGRFRKKRKEMAYSDDGEDDTEVGVTAGDSANHQQTRQQVDRLEDADPEDWKGQFRRRQGQTDQSRRCSRPTTGGRRRRGSPGSG